MKGILVIGVMAAISLGFAGTVYAEESSNAASHLSLQRDSTYEQFLRYQASADTAITPARVLRWINSLMGNTTTRSTSNFEFQPIVRAHDSHEQFIAQIAYKF